MRALRCQTVIWDLYQPYARAFPDLWQSLLPILHHYPFLGVFGSPDQQSIVMCSHFHSGIGNGRSSPVGWRFDVKPLLDGM